jgi:hypothetical protein
VNFSAAVSFSTEQQDLYNMPRVENLAKNVQKSSRTREKSDIQGRWISRARKTHLLSCKFSRNTSL